VDVFEHFPVATARDRAVTDCLPPTELTPHHAKNFAYAEKQSAEEWYVHASAQSATYGGKPWRYALGSHVVVVKNLSMSSLLAAVCD
jgi:hypothetical protein